MKWSTGGRQRRGNEKEQDKWEGKKSRSGEGEERRGEEMWNQGPGRKVLSRAHDFCVSKMY